MKTNILNCSIAVLILISVSCTSKQEDKKIGIPATVVETQVGPVSMFNSEMLPVQTIILRDSDFKKTMALLKSYRFKHKPMQKFTKDPSLQENWDDYSIYVSPLVQTIQFPVDCYYLGLGNASYRVIYANSQSVNQKNSFVLLFDPQEEIYNRVYLGESDFLLYTATDTIASKLITRIAAPRPESFVSRDTWDLLYRHECVHVEQSFAGIVLTNEEQEIVAYKTEFELLKARNPKTFEVFIKYCGSYYKKYGFCRELQMLCRFVYQTENLSNLEKDLIEPDLMIGLAMNINNVDVGDTDQMKQILSEFSQYIDLLNKSVN